MRQKIHSSWMSDPNNIYANEDLSSFEKILTIQALHPECLHSALSKWAAGQLGEFQNIFKKKHTFFLVILYHIFVQKKTYEYFSR